MSNTFDAVIIGAGVIGACTAFELAKKGYRTLSIDKLPDAGHGSTSASCAIIRTYYSAYETCALACEGWHYWKDWPGYLGVTDQRGMIDYHETGCLVMKTDANQHLMRVCEMMDHFGFPYRSVSTAEIDDYLPGVDTQRYTPAKRLDDPAFGEPTGECVDGAVFFPRGGYVNDPRLSAQNAQCAAEAHGAQFRFNSAVARILTESGRVDGVELVDGSRVRAPVVVNVAGPHSSAINTLAGVASSMALSTRALRHEVAHVAAPERLRDSDGIITSDNDTHVYTRPEQGGHLLIGSEDPECDGRDWVDDPDTFNADFTDQWKTLVMRAAQRLPGLGIPERARGVVALYDVSEDWMPIYDKSDLPGFYMACGTSGNQFKNAPVAGKLMAALVQACEAGHDHDAEPLSFHLEHIGQDIDLGAFSRNREINRNSSFSVIG